MSPDSRWAPTSIGSAWVWRRLCARRRSPMVSARSCGIAREPSTEFLTTVRRTRAMTHIVVDPVTRIEGHLRIEAEVDGGKVTDAWSSSTMFRGIEIILKGRDPRDAWVFAQRICGVCTTVHAIASIHAVEHAIGAQPPPNARLLRNLINAT